ncbi:hypothetical protein [Streptomyces mirabilis]|uniref:hypothetical protein n=1 Tax=Streptomyces mirabilis TaxID=68239 RepID=UPI0035D5908D
MSQFLEVEVETAVRGHLVVDRGPLLLAQRRVHGHREPHLGVGVHGERAAFGGSEVGAVRDALPYVLRGGGVECQPGQPPRGQVGFLPYPLRRLHHAQ